jgi:hypothetical protein
MPAGHRPGSSRTPVRFTAHWSLRFSPPPLDGRYAVYGLGRQACDFLARDVNRPHGAAFLCRLGPPSRSKSNGLIGQAWAVEALALPANAGRAPLSAAGSRDHRPHPYDWSGVWHPVEIDGQASVDRTITRCGSVRWR